MAKPNTQDPQAVLAEWQDYVEAIVDRHQATGKPVLVTGLSESKLVSNVARIIAADGQDPQSIKPSDPKVVEARQRIYALVEQAGGQIVFPISDFAPGAPLGLKNGLNANRGPGGTGA